MLHNIKRIQSFLPNSFKFSKSLVSTFRKSTTEGHDTSSLRKLDENEENIIKTLREYEGKAQRLSMAEEVRTLIDNSLMYGVLSTNSEQYPGFPTGSVVGFELDSNGMPFFVFSGMSAHTKDISRDSKCSLTILANNFKGAAQGRVVIIGKTSKLEDNENRKAELREKYLSRHKDAYWIDFGDFSYFTMTSIETVRYVGGFAMAGSLTYDQYKTAQPDPVSKFAEPVMKHMNEDHSDSLVAMIKYYINVPCTSAEIISMDKLGMTLKASIYLTVRRKYD